MTHILNYIKKNKLLWPILLIGFLAHMSMIFLSGTYLCIAGKCGLYFFGIHGTDSIWHLALSAVSFNSWPFRMPVFAGATLGGYNYLMDLVIFLLSKIGLPITVIFFKIFPILWFLLYTNSLIRLGRLIKDSKLFVAILLFLGYFCGSFAYFYTLWHHGTIWSSSGLAALQSLHALANMQYAFSLVLLLEVLILIIQDKVNRMAFVWLGVLVCVSLGLKFYGGVITVFLVGLYLITKIIPLSKNSLKIAGYCVFIVIAAALTTLFFYNPFESSKTGAILSFAPFATVHPTLESTELFYFRDMINARYSLSGKLGPRLMYIETVTLLAFIIGNFGIRIFGILFFLKQVLFKKVQKWQVLVFFTIVFSILLNILFVQKGEWWNTVQFLYYGIFLSTLFTAQFLFSLLEKKNRVLSIVVFLIILSSLPIDIDLLNQFNGMKSFNYIPVKELQALSFLKQQPDGIIFQPLYNPKLVENTHPPFPMFMNVDNAYVAAFSGKQVLYSTEVQNKLIGVDYKQRLENLKNLNCNELKTVTYAYIVKEYRDNYFNSCIDGNKQFIRIYNNDDVWIYKRK